MTKYFFRFFLICLILFSCEKKEAEVLNISLLSTTVNGLSLVDGTVNVPTVATFEMTFSSRIDPQLFEQAFSLSADGMALSGLSFQYTNSASKAVIQATLEENTQYALRLMNAPVGQNNEVLGRELLIRFTTLDGGPITEQEPCLSATGDCYRNFSIQANNEEGLFHFYSSFPLNQENTRWEKLTHAVIVLHGQNRDADNYFGFMAGSLRTSGLEDQTILIAPFFKNDSDASANDLYWSSTRGWREGQASDGPLAVSSFSIIDSLIDQLANKERFPVLEKVLITGHSSGALLTHVYAAANRAEIEHTDLDFYYVVANSQYFYYPKDVRWNADALQFEEVSGCLSFNHWPLGPVNPSVYLQDVERETLEQQFLERKVTYLLGTNDVVTTGTLNTSDCEAVLLGENRFKRGENIFRLMETFYTGTHQHQKITVEGVGHNAQEMYQSTAFLQWLDGIF